MIFTSSLKKIITYQKYMVHTKMNFYMILEGIFVLSSIYNVIDFLIMYQFLRMNELLKNNLFFIQELFLKTKNYFLKSRFIFWVNHHNFNAKCLFFIN